MLVCSAAKGEETFNAQALALNLLVQDVKAKAYFGPGADMKGTPVAFYSPALLSHQLFISIHIAVQKWPHELMDSISNLLASAAGLPIFMPYAGVLIAARNVINLGSTLSNNLISKADFSETVSLNMAIPYLAKSGGGLLLLTDESARQRTDPEFDASKFRMDGQNRLVDQAGKPYAGDMPYVVLGLDGSPNSSLDAFVPTAVGADELAKFFGARSETSQVIADALIEGIGLYNDRRFRSKAESVAKRMKGLPAGSDAEVEARAEFDRYNANIREEALRVTL